MLLINCPYCGERPEPEFVYGGQAHIARPQHPAAARRPQDWAAVPLRARQHPRRARRALAPRARLRALLQRAARHHHRPLPRHLQGRRAAPGGAGERHERRALRTASGGRIERSARAQLPLRRALLQRLCRRHPRLRAARQRRAPDGPLLQVPPPARGARRRRRGTQRAGHRAPRRRARHPEPARHAGRAVRGARCLQPEPLARASPSMSARSTTSSRPSFRPASTTRPSCGRAAPGTRCTSRASAPRPASGRAPSAADPDTLRQPLRALRRAGRRARDRPGWRPRAAAAAAGARVILCDEQAAARAARC